MKIENYGLILNVEKFDECVAFYQDVFHLKEMFSRIDGDFRLKCLEYGDAYLMIETGGVSQGQSKNLEQCPTKLRFNVESVMEAKNYLSGHGIEAEILENDWGAIININDPDGNPISIRDQAGFKHQTNT